MDGVRLPLLPSKEGRSILLRREMSPGHISRRKLLAGLGIRKSDRVQWEFAISLARRTEVVLLRPFLVSIASPLS